MPRKHVQELENRIASLEKLMLQVASANELERSKLLEAYGAKPPSLSHPQTLGSQDDPRPASVAPQQQLPPISSFKEPPASISPAESGDLVLARAREGRMCKLPARRATRFYGGTSLYQMPLSESATSRRSLGDRRSSQTTETMVLNQHTTPESAASYADTLPFGPRDQICRELMANFFQNVYQYNMCIYREYFLRDYDSGGGPYYSDALMYAICAMGAIISPSLSTRQLASELARTAGSMVFNSLDLPDLTILQSLVVLGHFEIGQGRSSKGWLFCGMACRLTHEMGLHLDPSQWTSNKSESSVDREILRRVYWAVFIADKQLSLYFGRPPALYPHGADVRNTIRIPYPPSWESLLDSYVSKGTSVAAFEDGVAMIGSFVHQVELAKIFHDMIVDVFENRRRESDATAAIAKAQNIHDSLMKWLALLPQKLQWNQWSFGQSPHYVLHLHMLFHTALIILHRPPRQHLDDEAVIKSEGVEVCHQSLLAILRLISSYGRYYRFESLPLDFVHTLSAAAEVIMMKRYMEKSSWEDKDISKPMEQILDTMDIMQIVYPCMREIRDGIKESIKTESSKSVSQEEDYNMDFDLMDLLQSGGGFPALYPEEMQNASDVDLGFLVTDDFLNEHY